MTRLHDPFTQALQVMRHAAQSGGYTPGRPIVIVDEARRLNLSTTPIREALAWLCGEGLVERAPAGGFLAPQLDGTVVRDRFAFRLMCLTSSLDSFRDPPPSLPAATAEARLATLLDQLVASTGNVALMAAFERVGGQLLLVAGAERRLFSDLEAEADGIAALPPGPRLRDALVVYHQRRIEAAPLLALEAATGHLQTPSEPATGSSS